VHGKLENSVRSFSLKANVKGSNPLGRIDDFTRVERFSGRMWTPANSERHRREAVR
jgi:hypothetical protein